MTGHQAYLILIQFIISIVAVLHLGFMALEMYYWNRPLGLKVFRHSQKDADTSFTLAKNQGLYNGLLAMGLLWSLIHPHPLLRLQLASFFLSCVGIAGIFGAITVHQRIFWIQAFPAIVGLILLSNY